jgi:asparagine synthase (glutamine-hydrolysing)
MKIDKNQNSLRKLVLRKAAENMGLPSFISNKPKKAVQYATGISQALKKTARKQKTTVREYVSGLFQESTFKS